MKKYIVLISALFLLIFINSKSLLACTCELEVKSRSLSRQIKKSYKESTVIFSGKILAITGKPDKLYLEVKLKVDKYWKTNLPDEIVITTGLGSGDCGFVFEIGRNYIVYAYGDISNLSTGRCSRTSLLESSKDLDALNKLYKRKN